MITLADIEELIKNKYNSEAVVQISHYQEIIKANATISTPETIYLSETVQEKMAEIVWLQSRTVLDILRDGLVSACDEEEDYRLANEIQMMKNYAGYSHDELLEFNSLKRYVFMKDQDREITKFLIEQFEKREKDLCNY